MSTTNLFHFGEGQSFEDLGKANGATHWSEEVLRNALGYQTVESFKKVIRRAIQACLSLGIEQGENFVYQNGNYALTRFACYLVAMNGDPKKPEVAAAQVYFATVAETFQSHLEHVDGIDRCLIRDEISEGQKSLASTAKRHGVVSYPFFMDAGYRGMYNMSLKQLQSRKGLDKKQQLLDHIGKDELAANLFRITQTDAKIKNENIRGQKNLEAAAHNVGQKIRHTMLEISGTAPENLPAVEPIKSVKQRIKGTRKALDSIDGDKKKLPREKS